MSRAARCAASAVVASVSGRVSGAFEGGLEGSEIGILADGAARDGYETVVVAFL